MQVQQLLLVWSFKLLLEGAELPSTTYQITNTCAVEGSTVLLPCTFKPLNSFYKDNGMEVPLRIVRVLWCRKHPICQGTTPSVFDSNSSLKHPQFQYLGDMKGNCTLQISNIQLGDQETYRFRMEADHLEGHLTNQTGITVRVEGNPLMRVTGSNDSEVREAVPRGQELRVAPIRSALQVEAESEGETSYVILGVVSAVLLVVVAFIALFFIIKRRRSAVGRSAEGRQRGDVVLPSGPGADQRTDRYTEDVSYAAVHFKQNKPSRELQPQADDVVYSAVVTRG
ncbi:hypothetical protein OJAV_G00164510 [Oryzias javanicus]|uniref:Ig-like domain-containing protein n=1 Tax=Oryzias javanicus TaxID=123683 RepID=A0A3S2PWR8_ORYJA|nr:hypothetical protein OJAV_G00164510 [Oryzias javanicus]